MTSEPLMVHRLRRIRRFDAPAKIERVTTRDVADRLAKAARKRQVLPEHLEADPRDSLLRAYVALLDGDIVGWVRSIAAGDAAWCSDMNVKEPYRRRGIARAMLSRMLRDDRAAGARRAVLLASHAGAKLYPLVGYEQIATLLLFTPHRARGG
jgi:GNAT superfamily N-acetyltransferase